MIIGVSFFIFLHDQIKLFVIHQKGIFFFKKQIVSERIYEGNRDFKLMNFLKSILQAWVDFVNRKLFFAKSEKLIPTA